ncbi:hypothetical protein HanXRQr2_Chr03g0096851 [Helianthus annuus]|uniref:Uncharacterized protein n=1 Tax=Helianthus annuus TaxID=4232 RepID=A0A9K3JE73_HELAN|nr:hypothetical protein HanXRQr2_Chr03g0096851 [Helianthus annuus]KAJ0942557.1 hypothetical protein HanPSC8_Chr03g0093371 [Helianthus annuus]
MKSWLWKRLQLIKKTFKKQAADVGVEQNKKTSENVDVAHQEKALTEGNYYETVLDTLCQFFLTVLYSIVPYMPYIIIHCVLFSLVFFVLIFFYMSSL